MRKLNMFFLFASTLLLPHLNAGSIRVIEEVVQQQNEETAAPEEGPSAEPKEEFVTADPSEPLSEGTVTSHEEFLTQAEEECISNGTPSGLEEENISEMQSEELLTDEEINTPIELDTPTYAVSPDTYDGIVVRTLPEYSLIRRPCIINGKEFSSRWKLRSNDEIDPIDFAHFTSFAASKVFSQLDQTNLELMYDDDESNLIQTEISDQFVLISYVRENLTTNFDEVTTIGSLYVKPEFRGRGYGKSLVRSVTEELFNENGIRFVLFTINPFEYDEKGNQFNPEVTEYAEAVNLLTKIYQGWGEVHFIENTRYAYVDLQTIFLNPTESTKESELNDAGI